MFKIISNDQYKSFQDLKEENEQYKAEAREREQAEYRAKWDKIPKYQTPFTCEECGFKSYKISNFKVFKQMGIWRPIEVYVCKKCLAK